MKSYSLYSALPKLNHHKTWAEIDTGALVSNYKFLCKQTPDTRHICVVKADAYGHGSAMCVTALLSAGCDFFAVSSVDEAIVVRNACKKAGCSADILILGYTYPTQVPLLCEFDLIQTIMSFDYAKELIAVAKESKCAIKAHFKIDTGMNRLGFCAFDNDSMQLSCDEICHILNAPEIIGLGMFSHFSRADEDYTCSLIQINPTTKQFARFELLNAKLQKNNITFETLHICNSIAHLKFPNFRLDAVRLGIMLYGYSPCEDVGEHLLPVMKLKTIVSHIHTLPPGEFVSYGGKFGTHKPRTIATLPIGYADGFIRGYRGAFVNVYARNHKVYKVPVVGEICMDQCMIDITRLPVFVGDHVVIFGDEPVELQKLSSLASSIDYEGLCLISDRVPRVYVKGNA